MATDYLNKNGLSYFWTKIKAWALATFAAIAHNQASNTITSMTGYSKPSSASAITASDTLNQAVGKLEKAIDDADISNVVHITGVETVTGKKTFTGLLDNPFGNNNIYGLLIRNPNLTRGVTPALHNQYISIQMCDASGSEGSSGRLALFEYDSFLDGSYLTSMATVKNVSDAYEVADIHVGYDSSGNSFARTVSTPVDNPVSTDIVTRDWIPKDTRIVHTSGMETINGLKIFNSTIHIKYVDLVKGTNPSDYIYRYIAFVDDTGHYFDPPYRIGTLETRVSPSGDTTVGMSSYKFVANSTDRAGLQVTYPLSGDPFALAPSTSENRTDGQDIVTRNWIPKDTRIVHTTENETIGGEKTFTSSPKIKRVNPYIYFVETDITNFTDGASTPYQGLYFGDKNENFYASFIGQTYSNFSRLSFYVYDRNNNYSFFNFERASDGSYTYASFPTPPSNSNGTQVVTAEWVNAKGYLTSHQSLANYVTLNGAQTITGEKTFTQSILLNLVNPYVHFIETDVSKTGGTDSGGSSWTGLYFRDKSGNYLGSLIGHVISDGSGHYGYQISIRPRRGRTADDNEEAVLACEINYNGIKGVFPETNGDILLGYNNRRWKEIWCSQNSINSTSDERLKSDISSIPDSVLDAWALVEWVQFKYNDAVAEKGASARLHSGMVAQRVAGAFKSKGLDASDYGLFLHDVWNASVDTVRDDDGTVREVHSPAGDLYGLRYVEALCMEAAYQRRENSRLRDRIASLEERLAALELKMS